MHICVLINFDLGGVYLDDAPHELLTRVFNYGSHRIYDFRERIRTRNDDSATLNPLILLH